MGLAARRAALKHCMACASSDTDPELFSECDGVIVFQGQLKMPRRCVVATDAAKAMLST